MSFRRCINDVAREKMFFFGLGESVFLAWEKVLLINKKSRPPFYLGEAITKKLKEGNIFWEWSAGIFLATPVILLPTPLIIKVTVD